MILRPAPVHSDRFFWRQGNGVADISDLAGFGRVYDDAVDMGLTVISTRTRSEKVFVVSDEHRDDEGDLTHWTLAPTDGSGVTLMVFND